MSVFSACLEDTEIQRVTEAYALWNNSTWMGSVLNEGLCCSVTRVIVDKDIFSKGSFQNDSFLIRICGEPETTLKTVVFCHIYSTSYQCQEFSDIQHVVYSVYRAIYSIE